MRRALLVALAGLAAPMLALGQSAGQIVPDTFTINIAQCSGVRNTEVELDDVMDLGLTWTIQPNSGTTFTGGGVFRVFASAVQPGAGRTSNGGVVLTSCTQDVNEVDIPSTEIDQVGSDITVTGSATATRTFSMQEIVAATGLNCTDATQKNINLCVQWVVGSTARGFATNSSSTIVLDRTTPSPPTTVNVSGGDGVLHVSCSGGGDDSTDTFKARATLGTQVRFSNQSESCSDLKIDGLTNDQTYSVVVFRMNDANNPSAPSAEVPGTPIVTNDFFDHYKDAGGVEAGGCSTAAGALGLVSVLGLLAVRAGRRERRKP